MLEITGGMMREERITLGKSDQRQGLRGVRLGMRLTQVLQSRDEDG